MAKNKKRANGDGSWRQKTNKKGEEYWEYRAYFGNDIDGNPIRKSFSGKTQAICRRKAKAFEESITNAFNVLEDDYTLEQWLDIFLPTYKKGVSEATYSNYIYIVKLIKKHKISKMRLERIKPLHITTFFNSVETYSQSVIDSCSIILYGAFEAALENEYCIRNPVKRAAKPKKQSKEKEPFTEDEICAIKEFAHEHEFGLHMVLLLCTGMRTQELRALRWGKIHLQEKYILIDKAIKRNNKEGLPKGDRVRIIPLNNDIVDILKPYVDAHKQSPNTLVLQPQPKKGRKKKQGEGLMYGFVTYNSLYYRYKDYIEALNAHRLDKEFTPIRLLPPHCTRHTYATGLGLQGVPQKAIQLILGHADIATTDIYTHLSDLGYLLDSINKKSPTQSPTTNDLG